MNVYVTTESENKLRMLFTNIKSFFILDVQSFVSGFKLDLSKQSNVYFINTEILNQIQQASKLKKYQGIIYINKNLDETLLFNLQNKFKKIKEINKIVLLDNGILPKHRDLHNLCEEVFFYERFYKNKIIECQGIKKDDRGKPSLIMDDNN